MPVLASGCFQGRKQKLLEVKGFCKTPKFFEERTLGSRGGGGGRAGRGERRPLRASGRDRDGSKGQRLARESFEHDEREGGGQRSQETWKDHKGVAVGDLARPVRHRGSPPRPKLPQRDPEVEDTLATGIGTVEDSGDQEKLPGEGRGSPALW